jgi:hypothetical protein
MPGGEGLGNSRGEPQQLHVITEGPEWVSPVTLLGHYGRTKGIKRIKRLKSLRLPELFKIYGYIALEESPLKIFYSQLTYIFS